MKTEEIHHNLLPSLWWKNKKGLTTQSEVPRWIFWSLHFQNQELVSTFYGIIDHLELTWTKNWGNPWSDHIEFSYFWGHTRTGTLTTEVANKFPLSSPYISKGKSTLMDDSHWCLIQSGNRAGWKREAKSTALDSVGLLTKKQSGVKGTHTQRLTSSFNFKVWCNYTLKACKKVR